MIEFQGIIEKFQQKGEKSGWNYIAIPVEIADKLSPGNKKSFRVKGSLGEYVFSYLALLPMGDGSFILPLNASIRKEIRKQAGDLLQLRIEVDTTEKPLSQDFILCLEDDPAAMEFFKTLPKGHQRYFSNWIETAKTENTKAKRISQAVNALSMNLGYPEMIRMNKKNI